MSSFDPPPRARFRPSRRDFLRTLGAAAVVVALPGRVAARVRSLGEPVRIGMIADLHQDIMHDGPARMEAFVKALAESKAHAALQLGDFAYPNEGNRAVIDVFNGATDHSLHVIGNHDMDAGHTREQCREVWGIPARHYAHDVGGLRVVVLDANDQGSPDHGGGYPAYVGKEQRDWLAEQLAQHDGPFLIASHQALAGPGAVDNAEEMQALLAPHADRIVLCVNGHSHLDHLRRVGGIHHLHVNSASYMWVGGAHVHESYSPEIHAAHPWIGHTCPYRDALFSVLTLDPAAGTITVQGRASTWVGPSPAALGVDRDPALIHGEDIAPRTRSRRIRIVRGE